LVTTLGFDDDYAVEDPVFCLLGLERAPNGIEGIQKLNAQQSFVIECTESGVAAWCLW